MKKIIFFIFISLFMFCSFAERRTRVDTYGKFQVKHIWDSNYTNGPDSHNSAKGFNKEWSSVLMYLYAINPKYTKDNTSAASIALFSGNANDNPRYLLQVIVLRDDVKEKLCENIYYSSQYNQAKRDFDAWAAVYEQAIPR